ncbi:glycosyltransferase family protein [Balneicella halophila]|uniref:hypothetical protein n=1 Tax=Balneicella halophila TaxID=1537566 RepID=UPI000E30A7CA|nr:hypothetical protein [Balneicella halophila]
MLLATPWFIWIHYETQGAYTEGFFIKHNINRFSSEMEGHGGLFIITWLFVVLGLFPFGTFIPQSLWQGWKFRKENDLIAYCFVLSTVIILFFSISGTKLPNYTLPAMPFLAILIAYFLNEMNYQQNMKSWYNSLSLVLITLVSLAVSVALYVLFNHSLLKDYQFNLSIIYFLIILVALAYIWLQYLKRNNLRWIFSLAILWIMIGLSIFYVIYPKLTQITPVVQAGSLIENNNLIIYKTYDPAFNINYQRNFHVMNDETELIQYIKLHPQALVLTKNKVIRDNTIFEARFKTIFIAPSVFENYTTVFLEYQDN